MKSYFTIGFTGTQVGMTADQKSNVKTLLESVMKNLPEDQTLRVVHGDCVGADKDFDDIAVSLGLSRLTYPCNLDNKRAHTERAGAKEAHPPIDPLKRNKLIVEVADAMVATPKSSTEELRSGTWATIRYTRKQNKQLFIFHPGEQR